MKTYLMTISLTKAKHLMMLCLLCMFASCACHEEPAPESLALQAAHGYYEQLLSGHYEAFLSGKAGADSLPVSYRSQLLQSYEQFAREQKENHGGIARVSAARAQCDSSLHVTHAFLLLHFADSTQEEISVPMVEIAGKWKMK